MLFIISSTIIGYIIFAVGVFPSWRPDLIDYIMCGLIGLLGALVGFLLGFALRYMFGKLFNKFLPKKEIEEAEEIYSLADSTTTTGRHYLFSGYINENLVFRYVVKTEFGKKIEEIKNNNVYIQEGDYTPTVKRHWKEYKYKWLELFAVCDDEMRIVFYVPQNSVTNEYNIDLK